MSALEFLTDDDNVSGGQRALEFLGEMYDEHVISIGTPKRQGETKEEFEKRKSADKQVCMARAAARGILNFKSAVAIILKNAMISGDILISSYSGGATTEGGILAVWFEQTRLEFALSVYERKMFSLFVRNILPAFKTYELPITDELATLMLTDDAAVGIPYKLRHAVTLVGDDMDRNGLVSRDTAEYVHTVLNDPTISAKTVETEVNRRIGRTEPTKLPGTVEIISQGGRRYLVITEDDMSGEYFERRTNDIVEWRNAA